jgi:hypothetical protein
VRLSGTWLPLQGGGLFRIAAGQVEWVTLFSGEDLVGRRPCGTTSGPRESGPNCSVTHRATMLRWPTISTNHIDLVKPTSPGDQVYTWVRDRIGRGSERIRRWSLVRSAPGLATLGEIIKQHQDLHALPPDDSGLLEVPEQIAFKDQQAAGAAQRLLLRRMDYEGSTVADVYEIAAANRCVSVVLNSSRRTMTIGVDSNVIQCIVARRDRLVCKDVPCGLIWNDLSSQPVSRPF